MDSKYVGKTLMLPKAISDSLEAYRTKLSQELGFKVSLSEAVAHLLKQLPKDNQNDQTSI